MKAEQAGPEQTAAFSDAAVQAPATRAHLLRYLAAIGLGLVVWWLVYRELSPLAHWVTESVLGMDPTTRLGSAVAFFLYDAPKVLMLLGLVVFVVGIIRTHFTPATTRRLLAGRRESAGNVLAAGLGIVTPFCSCSAVPLFIGFVTAGVPLGVTLSFLIAAPMVNEVALVLLFGLFGWKIAAIYLSTGLAIAIVAGWVIGRLHLEHLVEPWVYETTVGEAAEERLTPVERIHAGLQAARDIVGRVWPFVLGGIAVGAAIHGYVPENFMASIMGEGAWWSVPLAVILGVPMYSNAAGIIPVVEALLGKGAALGTVLAFMMAVIALSLPEMVILRRVLTTRLIAIFVGVVATGILAVGYLFNLVV
jgi:uncharacterized protein